MVITGMRGAAGGRQAAAAKPYACISLILQPLTRVTTVHRSSFTVR